MDFENHRFDHNVYSIGAIFINLLKLVYKKAKATFQSRALVLKYIFTYLSPFIDLENHSCGHIFCTFKANLIKLHEAK